MRNRGHRCVAARLPDDAGRLSHVSWLGSPGGNRETAGLIVVWQLCYPVQHVLDAAASMASSATFGGFCCGQYLAAVTTTVAYGKRRWANAITKDGR